MVFVLILFASDALSPPLPLLFYLSACNADEGEADGAGV